MYIESRPHSREVFKFLEVLEYHEAICFAYMEATVVGGSVAEVDQPAMVLFSN